MERFSRVIKHSIEKVSRDVKPLGEGPPPIAAVIIITDELSARQIEQAFLQYDFLKMITTV
jgi:hypothetical protein